MPGKPSPTVAELRGRLAGLSAHRPPTDPEVVTTKAALVNANVEEYVQRVVASAPPLTAEARNRLVILLLRGDVA